MDMYLYMGWSNIKPLQLLREVTLGDSAGQRLSISGGRTRPLAFRNNDTTEKCHNSFSTGAYLQAGRFELMGLRKHCNCGCLENFSDQSTSTLNTISLLHDQVW